MLHPEGRRCPEKRLGRARLSVRDPDIEKLVAGLHIDETNLDELRQVGKKLWNERCRFDLAKRSSGLFGSRRIDKIEAARLLKRSVAEGESA